MVTVQNLLKSIYSKKGQDNRLAYRGFSIEACPDGLFGSGCFMNCSSGCNSTCNHVSGACTCNPGYKGQRCDQGENISNSALTA